jgi:hypothetical protein
MIDHETQTTFVSPFAGGPPTVMGKDDKGNPTFTVTPKEMTPHRMKAFESLSRLSTLAFCAGGLVLWARGSSQDLGTLAVAIGIAVACAKVLGALYYRMLLKTSEVMFTPTQFRIRGDDGWTVYDRTLTHKFVMLRHDKTRDESEDRDMRMRRASQQGRVINPPRYFSDAFHIVFDYMGHRHDVLDVYDKNRALAILARFKACDDVMDNHARLGDGEVLHPSGQWGEQPGNLPA